VPLSTSAGVLALAFNDTNGPLVGAWEVWNEPNAWAGNPGVGAQAPGSQVPTLHITNSVVNVGQQRVGAQNGPSQAQAAPGFGENATEPQNQSLAGKRLSSSHRSDRGRGGGARAT
jgi:hypothetical protein